MKKEENAEESKGDSAEDEHEGKTELFVQGMNFDTEEHSLRAMFEPFGELIKCKHFQKKGKAFVEFSEHKDAKKALEATNQQDLDGRQIWVEFSGQAKGGYQGAQSGGAGGEEPNTLFVGNLGFRTEQWAIEEFFKECGTVTQVRIALDENERPRGFAHVEFSEPAAAKEALKLAGQALDGRAVRLDLSHSKRGGGGGGFGGGRGGRGGSRGAPRGGRGFDRGGRGGRGGDRGGRGRGGGIKFEGTRTLL